MKKIECLKLCILGILISNITFAIETIAYSGGRAYFPGNSESAIDFAILSSLNGIHIQVVTTKDDIAVLSSSPYLEQTDCLKQDGTPLKKDIPIIELKTEEIQNYKCGQKKNILYPNQNISKLSSKLLLSDFFIKIKDKNKEKYKVFIEFISNPFQEDLFPRPVKYAKVVSEIARKNGWASKVFYLAKDYRVLKAIKQNINWKYKVFPLTEENMIDNLYYLKSANGHGIVANYRWMSKAEVKRLHKSGKKVYVWGANDKYSHSLAKKMGVDGVISDNFGE